MSEAQKRIEAYLETRKKLSGYDNCLHQIHSGVDHHVNLNIHDIRAVLRELDHLKNIMRCASNTLKAASDD